MGPFLEVIVGKIIEIAFEAGPGAALQAYVVLDGTWSTTTVASVGISCLANGFATSMMAFDMDTKPANRKRDPNFYGFVGGAPVLVFVELCVLHSSHAMLKSLTIALLARTNWRWLVAYMAADHCIFILYKVARADLVYWIPGPTCPDCRVQCALFVLLFLSISVRVY